MINLIKLAESDRYVCKKVEPDFPDENAMRIAAYHIQQAVEKILKSYALFYGRTPPFTHDIAQLCEICKELGAPVPDCLNEIADSLTLWEAKTRYDPYVSVTFEKYRKARDAYDILRDNINEEIKQSQKNNDAN